MIVQATIPDYLMRQAAEVAEREVRRSGESVWRSGSESGAEGKGILLPHGDQAREQPQEFDVFSNR